MKGGAAKVNEYSCHCCDITSNELAHAKILTERCDKCISSNREWCYHWKVNDSEHIDVSL